MLSSAWLLAPLLSHHVWEASLDEYVQDQVESRAVKDLMKKVECVSDPKLDKEFPGKWPATVEIRTKEGKTYKAYIEYPKGDPENPLLGRNDRQVSQPHWPGLFRGPKERIVKQVRRCSQTIRWGVFMCPAAN